MISDNSKVGKISMKATEVAGLCQLSRADQKVIKGLSLLLYMAVKHAPLHRFVYVTFDMLLNSGYYFGDFASLLVTKAEILDNGHSLTGGTQCECLYLLGRFLFSEARETEVCFPL